jgi:hypothetical protein
MPSNASHYAWGVACNPCKNIQVSSIDRCHFPSRWLVSVASIALYIYCCGGSYNCCCSMQSIVLYDVLGVLGNVCTGTRCSCTFCDMVLVTFLPIPFWAYGSTYLAIVCILDTEVDACYIWTHALLMVLLCPSILGSNGCILSLLAWLWKGFMHLVGVLLALWAVSCLAVVAMQHINLLCHCLLGNYPEVSWESCGAAPF